MTSSIDDNCFLNNSLQRDLEDELLFQKQKIVALKIIEMQREKCNYTRHEKDKLVAAINIWMELIFSSPIEIIQPILDAYSLDAKVRNVADSTHRC